MTCVETGAASATMLAVVSVSGGVAVAAFFIYKGFFVYIYLPDKASSLLKSRNTTLTTTITTTTTTTHLVLTPFGLDKCVLILLKCSKLVSFFL